MPQREARQGRVLPCTPRTALRGFSCRSIASAHILTLRRLQPPPSARGLTRASSGGELSSMPTCNESISTSCPREPNAFLGHTLCTRAASPAQPAAAAADLKAADLTPPLPPGVRRPWSLLKSTQSERTVAKESEAQASGRCCNRCALSGATECCLFRRREEAQIHDLLADHHLGFEGLAHAALVYHIRKSSR